MEPTRLCSELRSGQSALADSTGAPNYSLRWSRFLKLYCSAWALMMYHEIMLAKFLAVIGVLSAFVLFVVLQITSPSTIHPVGLLGVFVLLYFTIGVATLYTLYFGSRAISRIVASMNGSQKKPEVLTMQRAYIYATVIALAPVILLGMRSVDSFGFIDLALVLLFEVIACFYIWRRQ